MTSKYRVVWMHDVDDALDETDAALSAAEHLFSADKMPKFSVCARCECGEFHPEDIEAVNLEEPNGVVH